MNSTNNSKFRSECEPGFFDYSEEDELLQAAEKLGIDLSKVTIYHARRVTAVKHQVRQRSNEDEIDDDSLFV